MELSKEQLLQIDNYISVCGIKYYDVRMEIVDHFANILEEKLDKKPDLDFKKEIENIHKNFSKNGFSDLLKEKRKSVEKKFYVITLQHLISFFKFPKIIISIALFYGLFFVMNLFEDKAYFFQILSLSSSGVILILFMVFNLRNKAKTKFLILSQTNMFRYFIYNLFYIFYVVIDTREASYSVNNLENIIGLIVFVLILLFFWSGEYVFYENKKLVKEQYPNVFV